MDYKNGDTITLEHPNGSKMIGEVAASRYIQLSGRYEIATQEFDGFKVTHVEPAPVPLPTVPGLYVARININALNACTIWRLNDQGWEAVAGGGSLGPEYVNKNLGGLVRLVPEA